MRKRFDGTTNGDDESMVNENIHELAEELYAEIAKYLVPSRETSLAITNLEQAMMWADKSISMNGVAI